ncbi:MAG: site-specific DNA-methyltransferase, partial [Dehalococcoidia bacterium]
GKPGQQRQKNTEWFRRNGHAGSLKATIKGLKPKDLCGMPWRLAFALQADGWWLRCDIIWAKPNPMPESCRDRPTKSHEYMFLLTKSARYFYDQDAVREAQMPHSLARLRTGWDGNKKRDWPGSAQNNFDRYMGKTQEEIDALPGRNLRSVWTIATQPFPEAHFATFPEKLVEPCIKAGTSEKGCCAECGAPWERVVERKFVQEGPTRNRGKVKGKDTDSKAMTMGDKGKVGHHKTTTTGWRPTCSCGADTTRCLVLDPFAGSGTVGVVAWKLGRDFVGFDLNPGYCEMANRRIQGSMGKKNGQLLLAEATA